MSIVQKGQPLKLKTGGTLHCRTKQEYEDNKDRLRKHVLYDFAMNDESAEDNLGAAATKWLEEAGYKTDIPKAGHL